MRHRGILFGLAIVLSAGLILYARSRARRQQLVQRAGELRESMAARAAEPLAEDSRPDAEDTIAASILDAALTPESEAAPVPSIEAPAPVQRREAVPVWARRSTPGRRLAMRPLAGAALMIVALAWSFGSLAGASAAPTTYVNAPVADAYVWATNPANNYGAQTKIRVDGSPLMETYLRFDVPVLSGPVTRATLRVYANSSSSAGWDVHAVADTTWGERTITFNNAPPIGSISGSSGPFPGGTWTSADVTSLVTGSGPLSMALTTSSGTQVSLASRESGATTPRLVVETSGSSSVATSTATSAVPPASTSTAVPTSVPPTSTATSSVPSATPTSTTPSGVGSATLPLRAAFYYPWFSPAWTQQGIYPYTKYHPTLGFYDERTQATIKAHIAAMQYGNISAGIASWWGQGSYTDARISDLLTAAAGTGFQWSIYYENESQGDPNVSQLTADLVYIRDHYASNANFLHINGKFVVFVYADAADACGMADRWRQANTVNAYVVLKVFSGYKTCASQPDGWHQYAPAVAADSQGSYSYAISPGFDKVGEATRLARDLTRWQQNVSAMTASSAAFQLVTTFNEWGEGTAVESASEWSSAFGYGAYLDALHNSPVTGTTPPPATATPPSATATPTPTPTPTSTATQTGTSPSPTASPTATSVPPTVPAGGSVTLVGAGDIAGCSSSGDEATAALVNNIPGTVFTLGDNAYDNGTASEYANCYDPSWGAFRTRTRPAPGNHDYNTPNAVPYYAYFGANAGDPTKGYYSYNLGSWHIVVLNGMCSAVGGCGLNSPQEKWLKADLAANPTSCTLAYWHFPLFSSGATHGNNPAYKVFWDDLYAAGAEVVLNGHEHNYERFAPQTSSAVADPARGIREFVVGTGGKNHYGFSSTIQPNSEVRNSTAFGVMKFSLDSNSYSWQFVPVAGQSFTDSGTQTCH